MLLMFIFWYFNVFYKKYYAYIPTFWIFSLFFCILINSKHRDQIENKNKIFRECFSFVWSQYERKFPGNGSVCKTLFKSCLIAFELTLRLFMITSPKESIKLHQYSPVVENPISQFQSLVGQLNLVTLQLLVCLL